MKTINKIGLGFGIIVLALVMFSYWYKITYSMKIVNPYEINSSALSTKILIATQGSDYKESIVNELINNFKDSLVYIKVIDVSRLHEINTIEWSAFIILHTWEIGKPQPDAAKFIEKNPYLYNIFVVTTSGNGKEKIEGTDVISGASILSEAPAHARILISKLNTILKNK